MKREFAILTATRQNIIKALDGLSLETLNKIPNGFNNNIIWNAAHVVVTQQLLCYALSGNKLRLPDQVIAAYRKGSKPGMPATQEEVEQTKKWLTESIDWIKEDYGKGVFIEYKEYPTSFGYTITSIEDAIAFNNVHEAMHLGWIGAIKKSLI